MKPGDIIALRLHSNGRPCGHADAKLIATGKRACGAEVFESELDANQELDSHGDEWKQAPEPPPCNG